LLEAKPIGLKSLRDALAAIRPSGFTRRDSRGEKISPNQALRVQTEGLIESNRVPSGVNVLCSKPSPSRCSRCAMRPSRCTRRDARGGEIGPNQVSAAGSQGPRRIHSVRMNVLCSTLSPSRCSRCAMRLAHRAGEN